ncbi:MAG: PHP domain-containing protein [Clostridia bacterium]|nr:PHP domain-containing protein [Clostridia bacterium]
MKRCDLHTHSMFSDGSFAPEEIIDLAIKEGLSAVALCDHHAVDGLPRFLEKAKKENFEAVAGVEIAVKHKKTEFHLVALFIEERYFDKISALMEDLHRRKQRCNMDLVDRLNEAGYKIDYDHIVSLTPNGKINRVHIGAELVEKGYFASIKEAIDKVLVEEAGFYKPPEKFDFFEILEFIKSIGASAVLAHPFRQATEKELEELLPKAKAKGLDAIECYYSEFDEETTQKAIALAEKFGLKKSGGSDFHGDKKPEIKLGVGKGNLCVPYSCVQELRPDK